nr:2458_t:CDS:2 [Entrophospora candida]
MNSNQAIAILADIETFLQFSFTRLTLADLENNNYTNDYSNEILPEFTISRHLPFNIKIDNDESYFMQFRLAVIIELMKNAGKYLEIDAFETDINYLDDALNSVESLKKQNLNDPEYPKYFTYLSELKRMCSNFSWRSLIALAKVVKQPVHTIYPEVKSRLIHEIYNCEIKPFQPSSGKIAVVTEQPLFIFWTNTSIQTKAQVNTILIENKFIPNHFVPCFLKDRR